MLDVLTNSKSKRAFGKAAGMSCRVSRGDLMQMAIASGNKVGISKRRQNDNEEGELKKIRRP